MVFFALLAAGAGGHGVHALARQEPRVAIQTERDVVALEPDRPRRRTLSRGEEHRYRLDLTAGECVSVIVEQHGIDVIAQLRDTEGATNVEVQDEIRRDGHERVDIVADAAGTYMLAITAAPAAAVSGSSYVIRLAERRAANAADRSLQEARRRRTAARALERAAKFDDARPLYERALAIVEAVHGPDDVIAGELLFELAGNALESRDGTRAEALYRRAIAVLEKAWGAGHPYPAMARSRLALLQRASDGPKAEALLREATDAIERTLGSDHPWFAVCLNTQASFRANAGDGVKAEELYRRALAIYEASGDTSSARYAAVLNNLGDLYRQQADLPRAEQFIRRALAVTERLEGPDSYHASIDYQNLGIIARGRNDKATALEYVTRALSIRERTLGADHADVAPLLNNLANLQRANGDERAALDTYTRALRIWERTVGPYHQGTLTVVGNLAKTYASLGDIDNAIAFQRRADVIIERQLDLHLAIGSERQKLAFVKTIAERTERTISLSLYEAAGDPEASALAALVLLRRKGRVLDAMAETRATARQRSATAREEKDLLNQLHEATSRLAQVALNARVKDPEERQRAIAELEARMERLEAELSKRGGALRAHLQHVTLDAVQAALPREAALVEFALFRPFNPRAEQNAEAYGAPRYVAYVVRKDGPPRGRDLGPAATIDDAVGALRQALRDPKRGDVKRRARAVDRLVMEPLRAWLGGATRWLIAPDGALHHVPFDALLDERGRYLIGQSSITYLTSGRDLLRMPATRLDPSPPVIVADPFFGVPATAPAAATAGASNERFFAPLAGTGEEARAIAALFPEATLVTGRGATTAALERLEAPRMLHIASHGFFRPDAAAPAENPLLRSGLALAGANRRDARDDGMLTALEASALNLWGTKLVTLSACDTGLGEVRNGEGVYGLRRAIVLAGAETLVMSLWPVSDYITRRTMTSYYTGLRAGLGRGEALRQAKLAMLARKGLQHPFYWASFIQSGEWASLDGARR